jgi:hypothetical protein
MKHTALFRIVIASFTTEIVEMDRTTIEAIIKDLGFPGRLVEVEGRLIRLNRFNDRTERFERLDLGISEFCDLVLDWRQRREAPPARLPQAPPRTLLPARTAAA